MYTLTNRLKREHQTLVCMTTIYCEDHHGKHFGGLCNDCAGLMNYTEARLAKCPYGQSKPTCEKCPIHCYKKLQRQHIRLIMRHAGPRMLRRHPWRAFGHILDKLRPAVHPLELRRRR